MATEQEFITASELVGRKIVSARYQTEAEVENMGWGRKAVVLTLDDGREVTPQSDDEGNDGGVLVVFNPKNGEEKGLPSFYTN
jgi:hypothetical protein